MTASRKPCPSAALQVANARLLSLRAEMARQRQQAADLAAEPDLPTPHRHNPNIDTPHTQDSDTHIQDIPKLDFYKAATYRANIQDRSAPTTLSTAPADTHAAVSDKVPYTAQSALKYSSATSPLDSLIHHLPTHLGWYSASVTTQLRRRLPSDHTAPSSIIALNRNARETAVFQAFDIRDMPLLLRWSNLFAKPACFPITQETAVSAGSVQTVSQTFANGNAPMPLGTLSSICDTLIPKGRETAVLPTTLETAVSTGSVQAFLPALYRWRIPSFFLWPHHTGQPAGLPITLETAVSQTIANGNVPVPLRNLSSICDALISKGRETAVFQTFAKGNVPMPLRNLSSVCDALIPKGRETAVFRAFDIRDMPPLLRWSNLLGKPAGLPITLETAVFQTFANGNVPILLRNHSFCDALIPKGRETAVSSTSGKAAAIMPLSCIAPIGVTTRPKARETAVLPSPHTSLPPVPKKPVTAVLPPVGSYAMAPADTRRHPQAETMIKLPPSLALAMLRSGQAATGRLWLLLRYLDENGRGWLELADVRARLTKKDSPTRLCGQRQLRALLQQGNGIFWQRDKTRVWLFSTAKVAAGLGVGRLQGNPIALPLAVLLEPIGLVRAHLYASFHSSRMGRSGQSAAPISRVSLTAVSGVSRRSQHAYERRAGVVVRPNIAMGSPLNQQAAQAAAWHHGRAVFVFTDKQGKQGKPGQQYLAWRLPNSYSGPHTRLGRGRQRQLNRQLVDLRLNGDVGNGRLAQGWRGRRYTADGVLALRCLRHRPEAWVYWQGTTGRKTSFWYVLSSGVGVGS